MGKMLATIMKEKEVALYQMFMHTSIYVLFCMHVHIQKHLTGRKCVKMDRDFSHWFLYLLHIF